MWFRLALGLGRTIDELQSTIDPVEFEWWCSYFRKEPWGFYGQNYLAAHSSLVNSQIAGSKKGRIEDFLVRFTTAEERMLANLNKLKSLVSGG